MKSLNDRRDLGRLPEQAQQWRGQTRQLVELALLSVVLVLLRVVLTWQWVGWVSLLVGLK